MNTINTNFDVMTYISVVNEIVDNYFNADGSYAPHYGFIKTLCTFFNKCVVDGEVSEKITPEMETIDAVNVLTSDTEFMKLYNESLVADSATLDFANAYCAAMQIIDQKKSSIDYLVDGLSVALDRLIDKFSPVLTKETLDSISGIAAKMAENDNLAKSIVEEYIVNKNKG